MKVYIGSDMEGISGVVDRAQISPPGIDLKRGRMLLTEDLNAAIRGARAAGASEILVSGGHGGNGMRNVIDEELDPAARLISGDSRPDMLQGLDSSYDAVLMIGFHTRHGLSGVLDHTITARDIFEIRINGRPIGEIGLNGLAAGVHGVPIVLVSGDDRLAQETAQWFPWAEPVIVKYAIGRNAARCMHPVRAQELIQRKTVEALANLGRMQPLTAQAPTEVELQFKRTAHADEAERAPGVERKDDCTVRAICSGAAEALHYVRTCIKLGTLAQNDPMR
jgi:D-amino peptidase